MLVETACWVVLSAACAPQDPVVRAQEASATRAVPELTRQEARAAVKQLKRVLRDRKARLADRMAALQPLVTARHEALVPALLEVVVRDKALTMRKAAAQGLALQPAKEARPALLKALEQEAPPTVLAELVAALGKAGYQSRDWDRLEDLFERRFGEAHAPLQRAVLKLAKDHEEKRAWRMLVAHLDEPIPADVDSASNPPAEYWEARWKSWRIWRADVKAALFAITGQRFSSGKEAKAWIKKHGSRLGLK